MIDVTALRPARFAEGKLLRLAVRPGARAYPRVLFAKSASWTSACAAGTSWPENGRIAMSFGALIAL